MTKYILAISGGIDSMALLDMVVTNHDNIRQRFFRKSQLSNFVVAHFDHGIRQNSYQDALFVQEKARKYGLKYYLKRGLLDSHVSEAHARQARYDFLKQVAQEIKEVNSDNNAKIVTAHHRDDVLETAIMFILRGTGWRGLRSIKSTSQIIRPLLAYSKAELANYLITNNLDWVEDETNYQPIYFRNRVRDNLNNWQTTAKNKLLDLIYQQKNLEIQIDNSLDSYLVNKTSIIANQKIINRYYLIMLDEVSALECLNKLSNRLLTRPQLKSLLMFIKTGRSHKQMKWSKLIVKLDKTKVYFITDP